MSAARIRVLHVEDNPGDVRLMAELLRESGGVEFEVDIAPRVADALDRLERERYDVVLLDLSLPDGQGIETVRRIADAHPEVPIVVLSGLDDETVAVRAVQEGAQDYLIKGRFDPQMSSRAIRYSIERHRARLELRSQSITDELTGLYNRRGFLVLAEQQVRMANRERCDLILVFCDLDNLKEINDTYGHQEGDRALRDTAEILRGNLRENDVVARLGGDEFTILALDGTGVSAMALVARLKESFQAYNTSTDRPYALTISTGVARREIKHPRSMAELLAEADRTLYEQKRTKRAAWAGGRRPAATDTAGSA